MNDFERFVEKNDHVLLSRRIVQFILGFFLFLLFISFMIGYFLGVKHATDEFVTQIRHETLADQLLISSEVGNQVSLNDTNSVHSYDNEVAFTQFNAVDNVPTRDQMDTDKKLLETPPSPDILTSYNAELIGFGTHAAAQEFINRVHTYTNVNLELKERSSKTPRGKVVKWYQVITGKYEQKNELQNILDILIKKEHLHDVKIVAYSATKKDLA